MYLTFLCIFPFYVFMLEMYINREYRTEANTHLSQLYMFSLPSLIIQHVAAGVCGKSAPTRSHSNFIMEDAV